MRGHPEPEERRDDGERREPRRRTRNRPRALARRAAPRAVQADARRVPGPLDLARARVPRVGGLLVDHDRRRRPHRQPRLADLLLGKGRHHRRHRQLPAGADAGDVHRHGPAQARPHQGPLPGRLHAEADRRPRGRDPPHRRRRARPARGPRELRPRRRRRPGRRLAGDRQLHGRPARGRREMGRADERDARRQRPRPQPRRRRGGGRKDAAGNLRALQHDDRRTAREPDRRPDQRPRPRRSRRREARGPRDRDGLLPARWPPATTAPRRPTRARCGR